MGEPEITWLSTKASAEYLGITSRTLYRLIDDGQLTAYKFGRVIRLKQSDVDTFIESSRVEPGSLKHLYPDPGARADDAGDGSQDGATAEESAAAEEIEAPDGEDGGRGDAADS